MTDSSEKVQVPEDEKVYGLASPAPGIFPAAECMDCMCLTPGEQETGGCICSVEERFLRQCVAGKQSLTPEQRRYCRQQIVSVEGYNESDAEGADSEVASTVLCAWTDFCRDKGML